MACLWNPSRSKDRNGDASSAERRTFTAGASSEVDGVWIPFREINHASGKKVAETVVRSVVWNPDDLGPFGPE